MNLLWHSLLLSKSSLYYKILWSLVCNNGKRQILKNVGIRLSVVIFINFVL